MLTTLITWVTSDYIGVLVQLFFLYTISLMIFDMQKPPLQTCILTGVALIFLGLGGSYLSPVTAFLGAVNGVLWLVVGYQRYKQVG